MDVFDRFLIKFKQIIYITVQHFTIMSFVTTTGVADLLGVSPSTIKRWVADGSLPCIKTPGGHRRFDPVDIMQFRFGRTSRAADVVTHCVELLCDDPDPLALQSILLDARHKFGSWSQVADMVGAVLTEIGHQWESKATSVQAEHRASNCVQQTLAVCVAAIPQPPLSPRCLLATVEGDAHTLGLSMIELCAREAGWATVWLGAPTATSMVLESIAILKPEVVAVSASAWSTDSDALRHHAQVIAQECKRYGAVLTLGGEGAWPDSSKKSHRLKSCEAFSAMLRSLTIET